MTKLEGENGVLKAVMEYDGLQALSFHGPEMSALRDAVVKLHMAVALTLVEWKQTVADPLVYRYEFTTLDGRLWQQRVTFDQPTNPAIAMDELAGEWRVSEFVPHIPMRDLFFKYRNAFGLTKAKVTIL